MKISIVSDLHLGDEQCALVDSKTYQLNAKYYTKFRDSVGQNNDFLVLAGDILDFSVALYQDTYECARTFFNKVIEDSLTKQFIYLPGNHDTNVWHTVEHETNIINQMGPNQKVREFRHSVPAVLDDRQNNNWDKFVLCGVTPKSENTESKYGGLYLDRLVNNKPVFNVAHPNLYLVSDDGKGTLVTHGHYFQQYWTVTSQIALAVAHVGNLAPGGLACHELDVNELVGINFPLVQLACTGIGQSGPLSPIINDIQKDVKSGKLKLVKKYISALKRIIDDQWEPELLKNWPNFLSIKEKLSDRLLDYLEDYVLKIIREISESEGGGARGNLKFQYHPDVQERIGRYYLASLLELDGMNRTQNSQKCKVSELPEPETIIFGHTHLPVPWGNDYKLATLPFKFTGGRIVRLMNCGGWLIDENGIFHGANVFKYETGQGIKTITVP